jgi:predicted regulator of Ras-like GTPase activity (Roadblock/LC7/MglB family)
VLDTLKELNRTPGVRGSAVFMGDGVVMGAQLAPGSDPDSFGALISSLVAQISKNMEKLEMGSVRRVRVTSSRGCFLATYLGNAWLVAELELEIDPAAIEIEIESAALRLRRQLRVRGAEPPAPLPSGAPPVTAETSILPGMTESEIVNPEHSI